MSALLGEEKPTLPSFSKPKRKDRSEGVAGPLGSKIAVLPVSSVGRKPVGGALAALLGLEVEEEEKKEEKQEEKKAEKINKEEKGPDAKEGKADVKVPAQVSKDQDPEKEESKEVEEKEGEAIPETPLPTSEPTPTDSLTAAALDIPLPPSPTEQTTPPAEFASTANAEIPTPVLSRMPSEAPSTFSTRSSANENISYDSMVSPLDTSTDENGERKEAAWPANKSIEGLESKLASVAISQPEDTPPSSDSTPTASFSSPSASQPPPAESAPTPAEPSSYSQYIFSDNPTTPLESQPVSAQTPFETPSKGFRAFNGSGDEGGFGTGTDDADSLRGAYSRSVEVGDAEDAETETGPSSPATEKAFDRGEREVSFLFSIAKKRK